MSRNTPSATDLTRSETPESGPLAEKQTAETGIVGSTFRLDAMSPGSEAEGAGFAAPKKQSVITQLVFFLVLIVAAGGVVFSMRKLGIGALKSFAITANTDYDVTKSPGKSADHLRVLDELSRATTTLQVPANQVQKNPFRLADAVGDSDKDAADDAKKTEAQRQAAEAKARKDADARARTIEAKLNTIKIHSIMTGSTPVARVNEQFVRVGDTIDEMFLVKAINERSIEIDANGVTYLLSLDEQPSAKGAPSNKRKN